MSPTASNSARSVLLAVDDLVQEAEQRLARIVGARAARGPRRRVVHPLDHDRGDQVLLGGEVAKQRPAADARALRDLADARRRARARRTAPRRRVEQPPPVALGICSEVPCSSAPSRSTLSYASQLRRRRARRPRRGRTHLGVRRRLSNSGSTASRSRRRSASGEDHRAEREHDRRASERHVVAGHLGGRRRPLLESRGAARLLVWLAASVERIASPSEPPTCWEVLNSPEARPASSRPTPPVPEQRDRHERRGPCRCSSASGPASRSADVACRGPAPA